MHDYVRELSGRYLFHPDSIKVLAEVFKDDLSKVAESFKRPGSRYFFRVNTLKTSSEELASRLGSSGVQIYRHDHLDEALYVNVEGPLPLPEVDKRIVVDKYAAESILQGAHVYAPAVLKCPKLRRGDEVAITDIHGQIVGVGRMVMGETEILTYRRGLAVEVTSPIYRVLSLRETDEYKLGLLHPQSLPAMVTSRVLDPQPGETIIDLNCSPGGKLTHISQLMQNTGVVIGVDRNKRKIDVAKYNVERLGCRNVKLMVADSRYLHLDYPSLKVDKCLVDPPCSALGVTPKLYVTTTMDRIRSLADYQKQFLRAASMMVKDGGTIVYSVCTVTREECEEVVRFGVDALGLEVAEQNPHIGEGGLKYFGDDAELLQRFSPHKNGLGYFIARLIKK
ncbi:MAG: PUA domain-containing protein [Candidatus Bathyarchaeia archaeon]